MNKKYIIKETETFNQMINNCSKMINHYFIIFYRHNSYPYNRYGISVGKKVGNAVVRNRLKRQIRAILSEYQKNYSFSQDCIIIVRKSCLDASFKQINCHLVQLLDKIKEKNNEEKIS